MRKKIFFASDLHLGAPSPKESKQREMKFIKWLEAISDQASELYLVGDIFDFWFEYKHVVPKGHLHFISKIVELQAKGVKVHFFIGNHDMWMFDYFEKELNIPIHREPIKIERNGKKIYIAHGDGLGPGDHGYKRLKKVFASKICQWLFARIHPNLGIGIANYWSGKSRLHTAPEEELYLGDDKEWLTIHSNEILKTEYFDYFIYGHRHLPVDVTLSNGQSKYINLGDWIQYFTYGEFDGEELLLKKY